MLYFLFYVLLALGLLTVCRSLVKESDKTDKLPALPVPAQPDPYELAYLRGEKTAVERLAVVELLQRGLLRTVRQPGSFWRSRPERTALERTGAGQDLPWHLGAALSRFSKPREDTADLWGRQWPPLESEIKDRLQKEQLLVPGQTRITSQVTTAASVFVLGALSLPILFETPQYWVVCLFILTSLVSAACGTGPLSKRGEAYLAQVRLAYPQPVASSSPATAAGTSAFLVGFALFGADALKGSTSYEFIVEFIAEADDSGDGGDSDGE